MKIGLLLSGGMGKGAYHIGALRAIERYIPREAVTLISASSIGCLNAYAYATGNLSGAEEMWHSLNTISDKVLITDIFKSAYLKRVIAELAVPSCTVPLYISLLPLRPRNRTVAYFDMRDITDLEERKLFLQASVALPTQTRSVPIRDNRYFDGGVVDNNPITPFIGADDLDCIIALYFDHSVKAFDDPRLGNRVLKICFDDGVRIKNELCLTEASIRQMIKDGEEHTTNILDFVFGGGETDTETIRSRLRSYNKLNENAKNEKIFTIARAISVLNNASQTFLNNT